MATYVPGAQRVRTDYNFVATYDLHKPEVDPQLVEAFGSQMLTELLGSVGNKKSVSALEYIHHESDRYMPKIKATNGGAGAAGAAVSFTLDTAATVTLNQNNAPYPSTTSTISGIPVRLNDTLLIKPASGTVSASTMIRAFVTAVDAGAGTFSAAPLDSADAIPSISTADEIMIYGNAFGEGSNQPAGRSAKTTKYTNNLQIVKNTYDITGSESAVVLWVEVTDQNGRKGYVYRLKGESDTYKTFLNHKELTLLQSEKLNNTVISNAQASAETPIRTTEGLIPFILSQGYIANYANVAGFTLTDMETLVKNLDKNKGSKENLFMCGIDLSLQVDREFRDVFKQGAVNYGNFKWDQEKKVALQFDTFKVGNYTFHKKTYDAFNDLQTMGASGFNYPKEGMVIPMDNKVDAKTRKSIPSLRVRYLVSPDGSESREMIVKPVYLLATGDDGADKFQVRYLSECGFEGFAGNRFAYVKLA